MSGSLTARRPMGFFGPFNKWWSNFFLENGRRPTKSDIETWRAKNSTWRPELTLEEIVQHSKGRRDPEKNRQYFVEYRRKLRGSAKHPTRKRGRGRRAAAKRPEADEPWDDATSDEQQDEDGTDDEAAQTSYLRRQQQHRCRRAKQQEQDDDATGPESPVLDPSAMTHMQFDIHGAPAANLSATASTAVKDDADPDAAAVGPESLSQKRLLTAASTLTDDTQVIPVPIWVPVQRARGPMAAKQLSCTVPQPCNRGDIRGRWSGAPGDFCKLGDARSGHLDSPDVPAEAATAAAAAVGDGQVEIHSAAASGLTPGRDAPLTASHPAGRQGPGHMGGGGEASVPQQPARLFAGEAGHWIPGAAGPACGVLGFPCWTAASAWSGAAATWLPGLAPMVGSAGQLAAAAAAQHQDMPVPDLASGNQAIGVAYSEGAAVGSSAAAASTPPFYDLDLQRTCSTCSISTDRNATAPGPAGREAAGKLQPVLVEAPAADLTACGAQFAMAAVAAHAATCRLSVPSYSRLFDDDLGRCVPSGDGSPSASASGATHVLHEKPAQLSNKRQRTGSAPLQPQPLEGVPQGLPLDGQIKMPAQATSEPCRPPGRSDGRISPSHCGTGLAYDWPSGYSGEFPAVLAAGSNGGSQWPYPTSAPGKDTNTFSAHGDVAAVSAFSAVDAFFHHMESATAACMEMGQQQHQQPIVHGDPYGGELEPEAEILDSKWLDSLFADSEMEYMLNDPTVAQQRGLCKGADGAVGVLDLEGSGDLAAWSGTIDQLLWGSPQADAVCFVRRV